MSRIILKRARNEKRLTQQNLADYLSLSLRQYQYIEAGSSSGSFETWDALEDFLGIHQRKLREVSNNRHDLTKNQ